MSDNIAIKVDNVSKTFRLPHEKNNSIKAAILNFYKKKRTFEKQQVLQDISFEIKEGEFFGIVGRNGSGKSTLLKLLAGIYSPSKGGISVNGKLTPFIELGVGFNPELTGRENVFLNGALLGFNRKAMNGMYDDIVNFAELHKFMDQKLKNYSSGMQVRLAFSIAIRANTDILLLDEVLAVGDAAFQQKCYDYFGKVKKEGKTVVFVTHDMQTMSRFCDRAILIDQGIIQLEGRAVEVAQQYTKDNFSGSSDNNTSSSKVSRNTNAYIESISIEGPKSVSQGESLQVSATIYSKIATKAVIGVSVLENMFYVGGVNSSKDLDSYELKVGKNHVKCSLDTTAIGAGNYNLGCVVFESPGYKILDENVEGPKFQVISTATHKSGVANVAGAFTAN